MCGGEGSGAIAEIPVVQFQDVLQAVASPSRDDAATTVATVLHAFGRQGLGVLGIQDVPQASLLRRRLLPLAREIANMPDQDRKEFLKVQGLGTDVSSKSKGLRAVSSFTKQLKFDNNLAAFPSFAKQDSSQTSKGEDNFEPISTEAESSLENASLAHSLAMPNLDDACTLVESLGLVFIQLGLLLARVCDLGLGLEGLLETTMRGSGSAKARLVHYHSLKEMDSMRTSMRAVEPNRKNRMETKVTSSPRDKGNASNGSDYMESSWQQWHCDYGLFTIITPAVFSCDDSNMQDKVLAETDVDKGGSDFSRANGSQGANHVAGNEVVLNGEVVECHHLEGKGLHVWQKLPDSSSGAAVEVRIPPDCVAIQVGEAAQILTNGLLQASMHCVKRPSESCPRPCLESLRYDRSPQLWAHSACRQTFIVFLQPSWDFPMVPCNGRLDDDGEVSPLWEKDEVVVKAAPTIEQRWFRGISFAEFAKGTTGAYYSREGKQAYN